VAGSASWYRTSRGSGLGAGTAYGDIVSRQIHRWWLPGVVLVGAVFLLTVPRSVMSSVVAVILLVYAWVFSPAFFPRGADLQVALQHAEAGRAPLVLWKPGCIHCIRLRARLGLGARRMSWVDSSIDSQARAVVRAANGGDHTTPTVIFGDETRTNPDAVWVRSLLSRPT
jgi:mycoredoxin